MKKRGAKGVKRKPDDKTQSQKFVDTARKIGTDETGKAFESALKAITPKPRKTP